MELSIESTQSLGETYSVTRLEVKDPTSDVAQQIIMAALEGILR